MRTIRTVKNSKGFGAIEIVVAVVVIAIIGVAGWMYINSQSSDADNTNKNTTPQITTKTYTNNTYGFSFTYPEEWTVSEGSVETFPDRINTVVKDAEGDEVLGIYGYLGTGCEDPIPSNVEKTDLVVAETTLTVSKSCNDSWSWVTAKAAKTDKADNSHLIIPTGLFIGTDNEDAARQLLKSLSGVSEIKNALWD